MRFLSHVYAFNIEFFVVKGEKREKRFGEVTRSVTGIPTNVIYDTKITI